MPGRTVHACVLFKRDLQHIRGIVTLQVDDSLARGDEEFLWEEKEAPGYFPTEPCERLGATDTLLSGVGLPRGSNQVDIITKQSDKIDNLVDPLDRNGFTTNFLMEHYIEIPPPVVSTPVQLSAPGSDPTAPAEFKHVDKFIAYLQTTAHHGPTLLSLDMETAKLVLFTAAYFPDTRDLKSEMRYVLLLTDHLR